MDVLLFFETVIGLLFVMSWSGNLTLRDDYPLEIDLIDSLLGVEGDVVGRNVSCLWKLNDGTLFYVAFNKSWGRWGIKTSDIGDYKWACEGQFEDIITYIRENLCH